MYEMILSFDSMPEKNKTFTHIHITAELLNWQNKTTLSGFFFYLRIRASVLTYENLTEKYFDKHVLQAKKDCNPDA